jgi:formylglycine-generating enzyme required for sulfatase activity
MLIVNWLTIARWWFTPRRLGAVCGKVAFVLTSIIATSQDFKSYEQSIPGTTIKFKLVAVPGGKFKMGSPASEKNRDADETQKEVEVSSFWMGTHEVTFVEWDAYFKDNTLPQSKNIDGVTRATPQYIDLTWGMGREAKHPTNSMSQLAAMMYCKWLYSKTGIFYRLPTEAEWEFACKGGTTNKPLSSDPAALKEYSFFAENSDGTFHVVGEKKPNSLGIFDLFGNLGEWTLDQYDAAGYGNLSAKDPLAQPASKYPRVTRGGSYLSDAKELRCANRIPSEANWNQRDPQIPKSKWWLTDGMGVGFRVVRPLKQPGKEEAEVFYNSYLK